jgi:hypothetical protein
MTLASPSERLARLATRLLRAPIAVVTAGETLAAGVGIDAAPALCGDVVRTGGPIVFEQFCGVPLLATGGVLCVMDHAPRAGSTRAASSRSRSTARSSQVPGDPNASAVVSAILALTTGIGMTALAEGVETVAQHHFLVTQGCACAQGFFLARPLTVDVATELLLAQVRATQRGTRVAAR